MAVAGLYPSLLSDHPGCHHMWLFMDIQPELFQDPNHFDPAGERTRTWHVWPWLLFLAVAVGALVVWRHPWMDRPAGGPPGRTAQSVAVANAAKGNIPITLTSLRTVTSLATATVKSQISGYLTEILFREGQRIKKGDLLAQVDPRPYQVALAQYQGQLEKDQALLDNARLDLARYQRLTAQDSISKQTTDTQAATVRQYEGTVHTDQAQVDIRCGRWRLAGRRYPASDRLRRWCRS